MTIEPQSRFSGVYVTAREPDATIETSRHLLVVAIARARNTGMKFSPDGALMLAAGRPPIVMEPARAKISVRKNGTARVVALDQDGRLTDRTIPVEDGAVTIDTGRDKTPYYLIRY